MVLSFWFDTEIGFDASMINTTKNNMAHDDGDNDSVVNGGVIAEISTSTKMDNNKKKQDNSIEEM